MSDVKISCNADEKKEKGQETTESALEKKRLLEEVPESDEKDGTEANWGKPYATTEEGIAFTTKQQACLNSERDETELHEEDDYKPDCRKRKAPTEHPHEEMSSRVSLTKRSRWDQRPHDVYRARKSSQCSHIHWRSIAAGSYQDSGTDKPKTDHSDDSALPAKLSQGCPSLNQSGNSPDHKTEIIGLLDCQENEHCTIESGLGKVSALEPETRVSTFACSTDPYRSANQSEGQQETLSQSEVFEVGTEMRLYLSSEAAAENHPIPAWLVNQTEGQDTTDAEQRSDQAVDGVNRDKQNVGGGKTASIGPSVAFKPWERGSDYEPISPYITCEDRVSDGSIKPTLDQSTSAVSEDEVTRDETETTPISQLMDSSASEMDPDSETIYVDILSVSDVDLSGDVQEKEARSEYTMEPTQQEKLSEEHIESDGKEGTKLVEKPSTGTMEDSISLRTMQKACKNSEGEETDSDREDHLTVDYHKYKASAENLQEEQSSYASFNKRFGWDLSTPGHNVYKVEGSWTISDVCMPCVTLHSHQSRENDYLENPESGEQCCSWNQCCDMSQSETEIRLFKNWDDNNSTMQSGLTQVLATSEAEASEAACSTDAFSSASQTKRQEGKMPSQSETLEEDTETRLLVCDIIAAGNRSPTASLSSQGAEQNTHTRSTDANQTYQPSPVVNSDERNVDESKTTMICPQTCKPGENDSDYDPDLPRIVYVGSLSDYYAEETLAQMAPADSIDGQNLEETNAAPVSLSMACSADYTDSDCKTNLPSTPYVEVLDVSSDSCDDQTVNEPALTRRRDGQDLEMITTTPTSFSMAYSPAKVDSDSEIDSSCVIHVDSSDEYYAYQILDDTTISESRSEHILDEMKIAPISQSVTDSPGEMDSDSEVNSNWKIYVDIADDDYTEENFESPPTDRDETKTAPISLLITESSGKTDSDSKTKSTCEIYRDLADDYYTEQTLDESPPSEHRGQQNMDETETASINLSTAHSPGETDSNPEINSDCVLYVDSLDGFVIEQTSDVSAPSESIDKGHLGERPTTPICPSVSSESDHPVTSEYDQTDSDSETKSPFQIHEDIFNNDYFMKQNLDESAPAESGNDENMEETESSSVSLSKSSSSDETDSNSETNTPFPMYEDISNYTSSDCYVEDIGDDPGPTEIRDEHMDGTKPLMALLTGSPCQTDSLSEKNSFSMYEGFFDRGYSQSCGSTSHCPDILEMERNFHQREDLSSIEESTSNMDSVGHALLMPNDGSSTESASQHSRIQMPSPDAASEVMIGVTQEEDLPTELDWARQAHPITAGIDISNTLDLTGEGDYYSEPQFTSGTRSPLSSSGESITFVQASASGVDNEYSDEDEEGLALSEQDTLEADQAPLVVECIDKTARWPLCDLSGSWGTGTAQAGDDLLLHTDNTCDNEYKIGPAHSDSDSQEATNHTPVVVEYIDKAEGQPFFVPIGSWDTGTKLAGNAWLPDSENACGSEDEKGYVPSENDTPVADHAQMVVEYTDKATREPLPSSSADELLSTPSCGWSTGTSLVGKVWHSDTDNTCSNEDEECPTVSNLGTLEAEHAAVVVTNLDKAADQPLFEPLGSWSTYTILVDDVRSLSTDDAFGNEDPLRIKLSESESQTGRVSSSDIECCGAEDPSWTNLSGGKTSQTEHVSSSETKVAHSEVKPRTPEGCTTHNRRVPYFESFP